MAEKVKVLVVDDSFLMRRIISDIVNSDPHLEVIAKAKDGEEAMEKIISLNPDVVTLDINLPVKNGIDVLTSIMKTKPTKVIMLSAYTRAGASATIRALELGAVDFIAKPSGEISLGLEKLKNEIISKIKLAANVELDKYLLAFRAAGSAAKEEKSFGVKILVIIGASTGGPKAILNLMRRIPGDIDAAFLIVQHMPKGFTLSFAERISWETGVRAKEAEDGDVLDTGKAFVAPAGSHLILVKTGNNQIKVKLTQEPPVNFVRPSIDVTMLSAAEIFGKNIIGVILTGMGKDGLEGARKVKEAGGKILIQDEESSVVWGMPGSVCRAGLTDGALPLSQIADVLIKCIRG